MDERWSALFGPPEPSAHQVNLFATETLSEIFLFLENRLYSHKAVILVLRICKLLGGLSSKFGAGE